MMLDSKFKLCIVLSVISIFTLVCMNISINDATRKIEISKVQNLHLFETIAEINNEMYFREESKNNSIIYYRSGLNFFNSSIFSEELLEKIKLFWDYFGILINNIQIQNQQEDLASSEILINRDFRSQDEVDSFLFCSGGPVAGRAVYDKEIDGTKLVILPDSADGTTPKICQLRNDRRGFEAPTSGILIVEYDFYMPSSFRDLPFGTMPWGSMKTFRVFNNNKRETKKTIVFTVTFSSYSSEFVIRSMGPEKHLGWLPQANTWTTIKITLDQDNQTIRIQGSDGFDSGVLPAGVDFPPIDNIAPIIHSTSRGHHGSGQHEPTFLAYRNVRLYIPQSE